MKPIRYDWQFPDDLAIAISWYSDHSNDLANRFRESIQKCLDSIQLLPESFPLLGQTQRAAMLRGFPWMIVYNEEPEVILIVRIVHTASNWTI